MKRLAIACLMVMGCASSNGLELEDAAVSDDAGWTEHDAGPFMPTLPRSDGGHDRGPCWAGINSAPCPPDELLVSCDGRTWGYTARIEYGRMQITCQALGDVETVELTVYREAYECSVNGFTFSLMQDSGDWVVRIMGEGVDTGCTG